MTKIFFMLLIALASLSSAGDGHAARIEAAGANLVTKVAPGEFLPVSLKLFNFGNEARADVLVTYKIADASGMIIYQSTETVAVETTASFIKTVQVPFGISGGRYSVKASIAYEGQVAPAETEFPFEVERRVFGMFKSEFILYSGVTTLIALIVLVIGYLIVSSYRKRRIAPLDYPDIEHDERMFYELISDTIMGMRQRVGDDAMLIAEHIDGLKIDKKTGRVLALSDKPSKIIASLVLEYEKLIGRKVSFSFRKPA